MQKQQSQTRLAINWFTGYKPLYWLDYNRLSNYSHPMIYPQLQ